MMYFFVSAIMDNSFISISNLKSVLWSFFKGLTDSLKFKDVFTHDEDIDRVEKMMQVLIFFLTSKTFF